MEGRERRVFRLKGNIRFKLVYSKPTAVWGLAGLLVARASYFPPVNLSRLLSNHRLDGTSIFLCDCARSSTTLPVSASLQENLILAWPCFPVLEVPLLWKDGFVYQVVLGCFNCVPWCLARTYDNCRHQRPHTTRAAAIARVHPCQTCAIAAEESASRMHTRDQIQITAEKRLHARRKIRTVVSNSASSAVDHDIVALPELARLHKFNRIRIGLHHRCFRFCATTTAAAADIPTATTTCPPASSWSTARSVLWCTFRCGSSCGAFCHCALPLFACSKVCW